MFKRLREGFTLIELSISIAFIALLSIVITLLTSNIVSSYQRGLAVKQINTTGMDLINDLKSSITNSSAKNLTDLCSLTYSDTNIRKTCEDDNAQNFVSLNRVATVTFNGQELGEIPVYGVFCTGAYSYIWNSGYYFSGENNISLAPAKLTYKDKNGTVKIMENFRLIKLPDTSRSVCVNAALNGSATGINPTNYSTNITDFPGNIDISNLSQISEDPVELLNPNGEFDLALYGLAAARPAQDLLTRNILYSGYFILATVSGGINVNASNDICSTPSEYSSTAVDYCAINKFNFAIQANGE